MKSLIYSFKFWFVAVTSIGGGTLLGFYQRNGHFLASFGYSLAINCLVWGIIASFFWVLIKIGEKEHMKRVS